MDSQHADGHASNKPRLKWLWLVIAGAVILVGLCGLVMYTFLYPPGLTLTAGRQQMAAQALRNPSSARLHLGNYGDINGWDSTGSGDFAVDNGMVIIPGARANSIFDNRTYMAVDMRLRVLVYAPDGRDVTALPHPPTDRSWYYGPEWYL